jgi:peptide chain release factor 1
VHRVQRENHKQGRVHTSAATVMGIARSREFDVQIDMNDVRVDFFCSGPGGQSVNTTNRQFV